MPEKYDFTFVTNGIYEGTADGYRGTTKVKVTVSGDKVTQIEVLSYDDDSSYFNNARAVIDRMIAKQSTDVDTVSGATYSSYGIINAVANALDLKGKETHVSKFDPKAPLADGDWYGTATEGFRHGDQGPSIVKVKVTGGQIESVTSEVYTDDAGLYQEKMYRLLDMLKAKTPEEVADAAQQIWKRKGEYYDVVTHATYMARGHISAVEHALDRSAKYHANPTDQQIEWMTVKTRPDHAYFGHPLDLKKTELEIHFTDKRTKTISFSDFEKYGITTNWKDGDVVEKTTPGLESGNNITVKYEHALSGARTHAQIHLSTYREIKYPDHILVKYKNGQTDQIDLENDHFNYKYEPKEEIETLSMYDEGNEIMQGTFDGMRNCWVFELEDRVPAGEGMQWGYQTYIVQLTKIVDNSPIRSFTIKKKNTDYLVDNLFTLKDISIDAKTENGNFISLKNWEQCEARGFKITLPQGWSEGYKFKDADVGKQLLSISLDGVADSQSIDINVAKHAWEIPDYIQIYVWSVENDDRVIPFSDEDVKELKEGKTVEKAIKLPLSEKEEWKDDSGKWQESDGELLLPIQVMGKKGYSVNIEIMEESDSALNLIFDEEETGITGKVQLTITFEN